MTKTEKILLTNQTSTLSHLSFITDILSNHNKTNHLAHAISTSYAQSLKQLNETYAIGEKLLYFENLYM